MNKRNIGNKHEREVEKFLQNHGYTTHRARASGFKTSQQYFVRSNDIFNCFDIIAKKRDSPTLWIQVTTGSRYAEKYKKIQKLGNLWNEYDRILIWLRLPRKKWKIYDALKNQEIQEVENVLG